VHVRVKDMKLRNTHRSLKMRLNESDENNFLPRGIMNRGGRDGT